MRLRVGARSDKGRVRALNEDVYAVRPAQGLFVVCDGMGGCPGGEVASQLAVKAMLQALDEGHEAAASSAINEAGYLPQTSRLAEAVRRSNQFIYRQAQRHPDHAEMGTTVVSAWIAEQIASVAHVGDSRAYLWHSDRLEPLTCDHSLVEAHVQAGLLEREAGFKSEQQHILVRVLGREPDVDVDVSEVPVQAGDYLLLCSDGLTRMVSERTLAQAIVELRDSQRICDYLVDAANRNGGTDNITVVVVEVEGTWWQRTSDAWRRGPRRRANGEPDLAA
jgi:protein phosphatase